MKLPLETTKHLDDICTGLPRTPFAAVKAVHGFLQNNFSYGSDENIRKSQWIRYPNQVESSLNCHDAGIYGYLMLNHLGVDCSLARLDNHDGINQSHYVTVVRTSRNNYRVDRNVLGKFTLDDDKYTFSKVTYNDVDDVNAMITRSRKRDGVLLFLADGQLLQQHTYFQTKKEVNLCFTMQTGLFIDKNKFNYRDSIGLPGIYVHSRYRPNSQTVSVSSNFNNLTVPDEIETIKFGNNGRRTHLAHELSNRKFERVYARLIKAMVASDISTIQCQIIKDLGEKAVGRALSEDEIDINPKTRFAWAIDALHSKNIMAREYRCVRRHLTKNCSNYRYPFVVGHVSGNFVSLASEEVESDPVGKKQRKLITKARTQVEKAIAKGYTVPA